MVVACSMEANFTQEENNLNMPASSLTFADKAISFFSSLRLQLPAQGEIQILNPYQHPEVKDLVSRFFRKYFEDHRERIFLFGINPGRAGGGLTGISFTDPVALRNSCGIENNLGNHRELSSEFMYKMIDAFGGADKFYHHFFMSAVCPLGFMKEEKNYNYYDDKNLLKEVTPFIKSTFSRQIAIGANRKVLICIGTGKNAAFIQSLNEELHCFDQIIPLAHPRFIMQYRRKQVSAYLQNYVEILHACLNELRN